MAVGAIPVNLKSPKSCHRSSVITVHSKGPVPLWRRNRDRKAELKGTLEGLR